MSSGPRGGPPNGRKKLFLRVDTTRRKRKLGGTRRRGRRGGKRGNAGKARLKIRQRQRDQGEKGAHNLGKEHDGGEDIRFYNGDKKKVTERNILSQSCLRGKKNMRAIRYRLAQGKKKPPGALEKGAQGGKDTTTPSSGNTY